jgi:choline dehydrogenase
MDALDFDVVVIGGGSAGCALACRLLETTDVRLCLVEAGPDYGPAGPAWPQELLDPRRFPTSHDWGFTEVRRDGALPEPRAKVIGGCSAHNQCAAVWGLPGDYDTWAAITGDDTWSYRALRPAIDDIEDARGGEPAYRGAGGRLPTRPYRANELASWQRAFLAATDAGFETLSDLSARAPDAGACVFQANVHEGQRWNAAFAFLDRVRDERSLQVLAGTHADRFLMRGATATALTCQTGSGLLELRARQFVLCAGTYGSPAILLRSGIGPAHDLERLGIGVVADLPGVGANLHDHPGVAVRFAPTAQATSELEDDLATGRFHQSQAALRTTECRLHILPYQAELEGGGWSFDVIAFLMAPASRGSLALTSTDPAAPPQIDFRFLADTEGGDLAALRAGADVIASLAATSAFASRARLAPDVERALARDATAYIRANVSGYAHAVGTCRMGADGDPDAVTDATGLVHGTENVRIADASLIPVIPAANTNLTCMLIGWRLAATVAAAASR